MTRLASIGSRFAILAIVTVLLAGSAATRDDRAPLASTATTVALGAPLPAAVTHAGGGHPRLPVPAALVPAGLSLRAGPVAVPLVLQIPSIGADVAVIGVGLTAGNAMVAPEGPASDPAWQQAFWYRGSAVPGAPSTALFAGHIDDPLGRPGSFGHIDRLRRGDLIVVHDTRTGLDVRFEVTGSKAYALAQTTDRAVLTDMYGAGPVAGKAPERSVDGLAHLTLVTCAGTFDHAIGTHDHRLVVFATRVP